MPRGTKDGSIFPDGDRFVVRRRYTDLKGREREKKRIVYSAAAAVRAKRKIDREIESELAGEAVAKQTPRTVSEAIDHCKEKYFKPAIYVGDTKVGGQRTWRATWSALKPFEKHFGDQLIHDVTHEDLKEYREERLQIPSATKRVRYTKKGRKGRVEYYDYKQRSIASVDRELAWARRVFKIAKSKKWIKENPFEEGDPLIHNSLENKKHRILSFDEERRLFAAFQKYKMRSHLAFAVMVALETGMRKSEQFRLKASQDVDLERRLVMALSYKGNRTTLRPVPITELLMPELVRRLTEITTDQLFDLKDPRKGFENACRDAAIKGVTWHTLRHTAITRMVHVYKIPPHDVMKISGHTNWKTFWETYVNLDDAMVRSIGASIDAARAAMVPAQEDTNTISEAIN